MALIVGGVGVAAYGLLPRNVSGLLSASQEIVVSPPEDAPLSRAHWTLMAVLVIALSVLDSVEVAIPSAVYSIVMYVLATAFGFAITRGRSTAEPTLTPR